MSFDESLPRHSHRTPAELGEDEIIGALSGGAFQIRFGERLRPDRRELVTLHSSRLFPVTMADCVLPGTTKSADAALSIVSDAGQTLVLFERKKDGT